MSHSTLIFIDSLFKPLYFCCKTLKSIVPKSKQETDQFYVIKFFGLGSLTRIAYVIENSKIDKNKVTFITFKRNKPLVDYLDINAIYIRSQNPFCLIQDVFSVFIRVWRTKGIRILDMERSSNLSGIFRIFLAIRKPCSSFYFKEKNKVIGNQTFVSLNDKPAINAIAELFGEASTLEVKNRSKTSNNEHIIININAGAYLPERMFPLAQFADLVKTLHLLYPEWNFILTGAPSERERVEHFETLLHANGVKKEVIINRAGQQRLEELLVSIDDSKLLITNDSGPMHCAQLIGSKTVVIWGPTSAKLVGYPDSETMLNLTPTEGCHPCFFHPKSKVAKACDGAMTCFQNRDINTMATAIKTFVEQPVKQIRAQTVAQGK